MKLPVIKHLTQFIEENDEDYIIETPVLYKHQIASKKRRRIRCYWRITILCTCLEVNKLVKTGKTKKLLNTFMKRVLGSYDQNRIQVLIIITHSNPSAFFLNWVEIVVNNYNKKIV
jgi:hypothetical protein